MNTLVAAADVKRLTSVGATANSEKLDKAVPDATDRHLRPLVGAKLLGELLDFVVDAPDYPTTTGLPAPQAAAALAAYKTALAEWRTANDGPLLVLWNELKSCLAQWVLVEAWPDLLVHIDEAGVVVKTGNAQGTTTADARVLDTVLAAHCERAKFRGDELVAWLERNKTNYPAYQSTTPLASGREPADWFGGISVD
jgi:hypothetical protein